MEKENVRGEVVLYQPNDTLNNIFTSGELDEGSICSILEHIAADDLVIPDFSYRFFATKWRLNVANTMTFGRFDTFEAQSVAKNRG